MSRAWIGGATPHGRLGFGALVALLAFAPALLAFAPVCPTANPAPAATEAPPELLSAVQRARYAAVLEGDGIQRDRYAMANPAQGLRARFDRRGVEISSASILGQPWRLGLRTRAYGYGERLRAAPEAEPSVSADRIELRRGELVECYTNDPAGLQQVFTVAARPAGGPQLADEPVVVELGVEGELHVAAGAGPEELTFADAGGLTVLTYRKLLAYDAQGRPQPARMRALDGAIWIEVDDRLAEYPLTIDSLVANQQAKLTVGHAAANDLFGASVAISGDTAVVGAAFDDITVGGNAGSAYVFVRSGTTWTQEAKLTADDGAAGDRFGISVTLIDDTAVIGAFLGETAAGADAGSAYLFVRSGTTWAQQAKLTADDGAAENGFDFSVARNGDLAVVRAGLDDTAADADAGASHVPLSGPHNGRPVNAMPGTPTGTPTIPEDSSLELSANRGGTSMITDPEADTNRPGSPSASRPEETP